MRNIFLMVSAAFLAHSPAQAQTATFRLDAATAEAIVDGCKAHATAKGQSHAIAVFDSGGNAVAILRMTGNAPGIMAFAEAKARAVSHWGFATGQMEQSARETPGFANAPSVVTVAGGVPAYTSDGRTFLGGVGVSGEAPSDDAACAEAGIRAAGLTATRAR